VFVVIVQAYLEDFYDFCQTLGDTTAEVMSEALAVSLYTFVPFVAFSQFLSNFFNSGKTCSVESNRKKPEFISLLAGSRNMNPVGGPGGFVLMLK